jgi:hypothetical protein
LIANFGETGLIVPKPDRFGNANSRYHTQRIQTELDALIEHLRQDILEVEEPQARALFETSAEVAGWFHPHDPYHLLDVRHSSRRVKVVVRGETVAETRRPVLLFEAGLPPRFYIPKMDVQMDLLVDSDLVGGDFFYLVAPGAGRLLLLQQ